MIIIGTLVAVGGGAVIFGSNVANGRIEAHTRPGAGPDETSSLPVGKCAKAPDQAVKGIEADLRHATEIGDVVVLRPYRTDYVVAAARIKASAELNRSAIPLGQAGIWVFESGIGATARPTDYLSKLVSRKGASLVVPKDLSQRVSQCIEAHR